MTDAERIAELDGRTAKVGTRYADVASAFAAGEGTVARCGCGAVYAPALESVCPGCVVEFTITINLEADPEEPVKP
jgi:hypothetical protein